jgi:hypothetical protein
MADASAPDPTRDASGDDAAPDATSDAWSAWLPDLGAPAPSTTGDPTPPTAPPPPPAAAPAPAPAPPAPSTAPPLPHLPPPPRSPRASFSLTVTPRGGRSQGTGWSYSTGWNFGTGRPAPPVAPGQPPTYLGLAVFALVVWAVPFGIVALVRSLQVAPRWTAGRYEQARAASRSARRWSIAAIVALPCVFLLLPFLLGLASLSHV